MTTADMHLITD